MSDITEADKLLDRIKKIKYSKEQKEYLNNLRDKYEEYRVLISN